MTKKKIGELEGTPIVTGDKNYANEHEYYMTLNGDNTYQKLEQRTNGDLFRTVLGGGSDSGSGCDCGGFKYNEWPLPVEFRDPTTEELSKYQDRPLHKVLDLKDGTIPYKIILGDPIDSNVGGIFNLYSYYKDQLDDEISVNYYTVINGMNSGIQVISLANTFTNNQNDLVSIRISSDGSLMLVYKINASVG